MVHAVSRQNPTTMHALHRCALRLSTGLAIASLTLFIAGCASTGEGSGSAPPAASAPASRAPSPASTADFPVIPAAPRPTQICNAKPVQFYIGHNTVTSTLETIRKKSGAYMLRVLSGDQPATTDYNQERLNVIANEAGKITALRCG